MGLDGDSRDERLYRKMFFIRHFEQTLLQLFDSVVLNGTTHCCIGQEANCVGVIENLEGGDHIFSNHRCHGHYLALTGDALGLLAEIMGKDAGVCGGKGGSQHICAPHFKSNGILGGTAPAAAGIAMAEQLRKTTNLSVLFMGDGALGEGVVYETLNLASLWKLPLFIVCEDNGWSQSTPKHLNMAGDIVSRFRAFGIPTRELDTTDVHEIHAAAGEEVGKARANGGPRALVIHTYRLCHHSKNDDNRPAAEVEAHWKIEPLVIHGPRVESERRNAIEAEVQQAIQEVIDRARALP